MLFIIEKGIKLTFCKLYCKLMGSNLKNNPRWII